MLSSRIGLALVFVLALAAMAGTAALVLPDGSEEPEATSSPPQGVIFRAPRLGIVGVRPARWRLERSPRAVRVRSPDRAGLVAVSATPSPVSASALMASTLAAVRRSYRGARLSARRRTRVGGLAGTAVGGRAANSRGVRLDLLLATAGGRRRTYLLQVFVARAAAGRRLAEAQDVVNSLELSG